MNRSIALTEVWHWNIKQRCFERIEYLPVFTASLTRYHFELKMLTMNHMMDIVMKTFLLDMLPQLESLMFWCFAWWNGGPAISQLSYTELSSFDMSWCWRHIYTYIHTQSGVKTIACSWHSGKLPPVTSQNSIKNLAFLIDILSIKIVLISLQ